MIQTITALFCGFVLDLLLGDPQWMYHPVRIIGHLIIGLESALRKLFHCPPSDTITADKKTQRRELTAGFTLVILVLIFSFSFPVFLLILAESIHPALNFILKVIFCYQLLAAKSLKAESCKVYTELAKGDLEQARYQVSMIVGRDTAKLNEIGITKAAIETIAENTSDGVTAPFIFMAAGGPVAGFLYKAVNTMDSMIGYKNSRYYYFGRTAAKLDDICNYIPARLSACLMIIASFLLRLDYKNAIKIFKRDRCNHKSPNSAQTESVCAGALNIKLAGDASYFGKIHKKPTIGDANTDIKPEHILIANKLMYTTAILTLLTCSLIIILLYFMERSLL